MELVTGSGPMLNNSTALGETAAPDSSAADMAGNGRAAINIMTSKKRRKIIQ